MTFNDELNDNPEELETQDSIEDSAEENGAADGAENADDSVSEIYVDPKWPPYVKKAVSKANVKLFTQRMEVLLEPDGAAKHASAVTGIPAPTISRYKNARRLPSSAYIMALADYFKVSIDWLIGLDNREMHPVPYIARRVVEAYFLCSPEDREVVEKVFEKHDAAVTRNLEDQNEFWQKLKDNDEEASEPSDSE